MRRRWWLFRATDFQSLMYPCFTFCRILGIFPYKINSSTLEASKPHYIMSTVIACVFCIFDVTLIYNIIVSKITFGEITRNLEVVCFYTFCGIIMIIMYVLSGPQMRLLQTILKISSKLPPKSYQQLSRLVHIKDILGFIFVVLQMCMYFPKTQIFNSLDIFTEMFTLYCTLLIFQINMLYINCVYILKDCFKNINDNLAHMQHLVVNDTKPCVAKLIYHMQKNQCFLIELNVLKRQHLMVSDAVQMLNTIFSLQLLASISIIFSNVTFELYFYAVRWQNGLFISFDKHFFDIFISCLIYHATLIMLLVWVCETCKNQAHEIRVTVHDLLNSTSNQQIKDELQLFSLQILHRENVFSAKGFTVDATLLAAMVGSITTYMLILIQFLIMSHSCDGK